MRAGRNLLPLLGIVAKSAAGGALPVSLLAVGGCQMAAAVASTLLTGASEPQVVEGLRLLEDRVDAMSGKLDLFLLLNGGVTALGGGGIFMDRKLRGRTRSSR